MLNEDQIQKVRTTISTAGWTEIMHPLIRARGNGALKALTLGPEERQKSGGEFKDTSDSDLRSIIRDCEWMAVCWQNEISVFEYNRRLEEEARQSNGVTT